MFQKNSHIQKQDQKKTIKNMSYKRINLSKYKNTQSSSDDYELNPKEKYLLIDFEQELEFQFSILMSFQITGTPPALVNYHSWLFKNGFNPEEPNPTNEFVSKYYGAKPLWKTEYSQGIVVKVENDDDYYIVMECSHKNKGYKHTRVILTLGGCI